MCRQWAHPTIIQSPTVMVLLTIKAFNTAMFSFTNVFYLPECAAAQQARSKFYMLVARITQQYSTWCTV